MPAERLQKLLARAGYGSRRAAERLIEAGRVTVNGRMAVLGMRASPERDAIAVDGRPLASPPPSARALTLMLHKPVGYIVTAADERGRRTVYDLLPDAPPNLRYAGRLDRDTSGLLLLTTDGELAHRLTHPRYRVAKTYEAAVRGLPDDEALQRLRRGVLLDDGPTAPAEVTLTERAGGTGGAARVRLVIHEGRKRQVRRMLQAVGHPVVSLVRVAVAGLALGDLPTGASRPISGDEEARLRRATEKPAAARSARDQQQGR